MARGFSLLEVLIAVVVLSVGLLALAALQAALIRSSGETKAESTGLSLAEEQLESMRAFESLDAYRQLASIDAGSAVALNDDDGVRGAGALGGTNYTRWQDVTRYVFDKEVAEFVAVDDSLIDATDDELIAANEDLQPGTEFKRVEVHVGWTDATGASRTVTLLDTLSATDPADSSRVLSKPPGGPRQPQALIYNPANESGVIPVAIGDGSETAATNPRPEVVGQGDNSTVIETRFDVLTYAALQNDSALAQAQSRIETALVGCTCTTATPAAAPAFRPTYWNGFRYAAPDVASYNPPAGPLAGQGNNKVTQSPLCTQCCRDHSDPAGVTPPKFDPFRDQHEHFLDIAGDAVTTGTYRESCRIIRVDGIMRVASDMNMEYFGLLATTSNALSPIPDATYAETYEDFVLAYLDTRFVSGTAYNTQLTAEAEASAASMGLDLPSSLSIQEDASRWLHARGIYIDYLESDAIARVNEAKADCGDPSELDGCVLPFVPFTTINLTELARWSSFDTPDSDPRTDTQIEVTSNSSVEFGNPLLPIRGEVTLRASAENGRTADAVAASGKSNAAIALVAPIDPVDATTLLDTQAFAVGEQGSGAEFSVTLNGGLQFIPGNFPAIQSVIAGVEKKCNEQGTTTNPNPYRCDVESLPAPGGAIEIAEYNVYGLVSWTGPCGGGKTVDAPVCETYTVSRVVNSLGQEADLTVPAAHSGKVSETTTATFTSPNSISLNDVITVTFSNRSISPVNQTAPICDGNKLIGWTTPCDKPPPE